MGNQEDAGRYINKISNRLQRNSGKMEEKLGITRVQGNLLGFILLEGMEKQIYQKMWKRNLTCVPPRPQGY